ncbi:MAG: hypothetical protein H7A25_24385 [Leptospiraceae bacterium]|nr:hypothetical protein [Leptospiraceae bacterium]MCP5503059.1 hypothetical protein [Leptospiraceae bacterium]
MSKLKILVISSLLFYISLGADPLSDEEIKSFNIKDLYNTSFDKRMNTFRIIKELGYREKYKQELEKAVLYMLKHKDIFYKRTGIQGENMFHLGNSEVHELILKNAEDTQYESGNQFLYFRASIMEYLSYELEKARKKLLLCK